MPPSEHRVFAVYILAAFVLSCCFPVFLPAQTLGDDVHINPRPQPVQTAPPGPIVDAALKTHSKPIKVDVDLVTCSRYHHRSNESPGHRTGQGKFQHHGRQGTAGNPPLFQ